MKLLTAWNFVFCALFFSSSIFSSVSKGSAKPLESADGNIPPKEKFTNAQESFELVKQMLLQRYYQSGVTEEDIYRAAAKGMLENLDPKMAEWNRLLSPAERKELEQDLAGELVGAGVEIKFDRDSGMSEIVYVIPESPAQAAGVLVGDRILSVNGKFYRGGHLREVVEDIRGKVGDSRKLSILRADKVLSKTLSLKPIPYAVVTSSLLPNGVGLLRIPYFTGVTAAKVKLALKGLRDQKVKGLVLDLRGNAGGIFDAATESASLLIPKGKTIAKISRRGGTQEVILSKEDPILPGLPMVVMVNEETSSGAEVFTAALQENLDAVVVGTRTHGKWSIQKLEDLPNQYAAKYTVGLMYSPSGASYPGTGLSPDVEVNVAAEEVAKLQRIADPAKRIAADAQLRTAVGMVKARF